MKKKHCSTTISPANPLGGGIKKIINILIKPNHLHRSGNYRIIHRYYFCC